MKPMVLVSAVICYAIAATICFLVQRYFGLAMPEMPMIVGAVLGSQIPAMVHHRDPNAQPSAAVKAALGAVLAACTVIYGVIIAATFGLFEYPEISIAIGTIGTFFFPFFVFGQMWNALERQKARR